MQKKILERYERKGNIMGLFDWKKKQEKPVVQENTPVSCSEIAQEIVDRLNCPYQVFAKGNTIEHVNKAYLRARVRGLEQGFIPVVVQADDTLAEWLGILEDESYSKEKILNQKAGNGAEVLKNRWKEYAEDYIEDFGEGTREDTLGELLGEMVDGERLSALTTFMSFSGEGIEESILFEIPVKNPWEVIAWLPMGGWNECPPAEEMMEVCRYWYEKYGAVPAALSHDTLEFYIEKPVENEEEVWELAKEHYAFCPDRVDQGTANGTIGEVADSLRKSQIWYFWWD